MALSNRELEQFTNHAVLFGNFGNLWRSRLGQRVQVSFSSATSRCQYLSLDMDDTNLAVKTAATRAVGMDDRLTALRPNELVRTTLALAEVAMYMGEKITPDTAKGLSGLADLAMTSVASRLGSEKEGSPAQKKSVKQLQMIAGLAIDDGEGDRGRKKKLFEVVVKSDGVPLSVKLNTMAAVPQALATQEPDVVRAFGYACQRELNPTYVYQKLKHMTDKLENPTATWLALPQEQALQRLRRKPELTSGVSGPA
jgi:hypothetical protein